MRATPPRDARRSPIRAIQDTRLARPLTVTTTVGIALSGPTSFLHAKDTSVLILEIVTVEGAKNALFGRQPAVQSRDYGRSRRSVQSARPRPSARVHWPLGSLHHPSMDPCIWNSSAGERHALGVLGTAVALLARDSVMFSNTHSTLQSRDGYSQSHCPHSILACIVDVPLGSIEGVVPPDRQGLIECAGPGAESLQQVCQIRVPANPGVGKRSATSLLTFSLFSTLSQATS